MWEPTPGRLPPLSMQLTLGTLRIFQCLTALTIDVGIRRYMAWESASERALAWREFIWNKVIA